MRGGITPANALTRAESLLKNQGSSYTADDVAVLAEFLVKHESPRKAYEMYLRYKGITPDSELSGNLAEVQEFMAP